jgi:hypothetical protein
MLLLEKLLIFILIFLFFNTNILFVNSGCISGYLYEPSINACYKFTSGTSVSGTTAKSNCISSGGYLMSASTSSRHTFIFSTIGAGNKNIWIGLSSSSGLNFVW